MFTVMARDVFWGLLEVRCDAAHLLATNHSTSTLPSCTGGFDIELFRRAAKQLGWVESECSCCRLIAAEPALSRPRGMEVCVAACSNALPTSSCRRSAW